MNDVPQVGYRFGDKYWITDFVTPNNPDIELVVKGFDAGNNDGLVSQVASYIRDGFQYPLFGNLPSADGKILRYNRRRLFSVKYRWKVYRYYVWAFPAEVIQSKLGYCAETANLCVSLLRTRELDSWNALGEVRASKDNTLLGYHSWVICRYQGEPYILESTIHKKGVNNLVKVSSAYDKYSAWAMTRDLYYVERARYNDKEFRKDSSIVASMAFPAKRILLFGLKKTEEFSSKKLYKEWKLEERLKTRLLEKAYK